MLTESEIEDIGLLYYKGEVFYEVQGTVYPGENRQL